MEAEACGEQVVDRDHPAPYGVLLGAWEVAGLVAAADGGAADTARGGGLLRDASS
ncbi:hypothetical protein OOK43_32100 [[Kitasatospora] papulosa]|nr:MULTISPECIES: hypothetical protein [Streptomyces]MCX4417881.1 hypothetical protein [[Kitasatospora] papulosa]MCY1649380.1 hypothetical protein [Streptomyces sp. SL203]MCY1677092.1 hypothetical protein [Streptomyces sp. SL294]